MDTHIGDISPGRGVKRDSSGDNKFQIENDNHTHSVSGSFKLIDDHKIAAGPSHMAHAPGEPDQQIKEENINASQSTSFLNSSSDTSVEDSPEKKTSSDNVTDEPPSKKLATGEDGESRKEGEGADHSDEKQETQDQVKSKKEKQEEERLKMQYVFWPNVILRKKNTHTCTPYLGKLIKFII